MTNRLPMDSHSHSEHSSDGYYPVKEMCEEALKKQIEGLAITDHYDIGSDTSRFPALDAMLMGSVRDALAAKEAYAGRLKTLVGIELGQPLENRAKAEEILGLYPFDFVLGALHNAPGSPDFYYIAEGERADFDRELTIYFTHMLELISWGAFDSVAHITYPFRYIIRKDESYPFERWDDHLDAIVKAVAAAGLALELNTSGLRREPSYTMPEARWISRFKECGGEKLTLGSDAHRLQQLGVGVAEGMDIAAEAGFRHLCYFEKRLPQFIKLEDYR